MTKRPSFLSKDFLGERLVPEVEVDTVQYFDHIRRYQLAQQYVYNRRVLDVACGTGYGGDILLRGGAQQVISVDVSAPALRYAVGHWNRLHFTQADATHLPLPAASAGVEVSFETIEHLADSRAFLAEVSRILEPGGLLILSTPNRAVARPGSDKPYSPYHTLEPTRSELLVLLTEAGWQVLALYGMAHSCRAQATIQSASAPYAREPSKTAWTAYLRLAVRAVLPPILYRWLGRARRIPDVAITDSVLHHEAGDGDAYFVALCTFMLNR